MTKVKLNTSRGRKGAFFSHPLVMGLQPCLQPHVQRGARVAELSGTSRRSGPMTLLARMLGPGSLDETWLCCTPSPPFVSSATSSSSSSSLDTSTVLILFPSPLSQHTATSIWYRTHHCGIPSRVNNPSIPSQQSQSIGEGPQGLDTGNNLGYSTTRSSHGVRKSTMIIYLYLSDNEQRLVGHATTISATVPHRRCPGPRLHAWVPHSSPAGHSRCDRRTTRAMPPAGSSSSSRGRLKPIFNY